MVTGIRRWIFEDSEEYLEICKKIDLKEKVESRKRGNLE